MFFPFWTVFSLAVLGVGTTAEISDLAGVSQRQVRLHLDSLFTLCRKDGWKWHSVLSPAEVGELHLNLNADQVAHRRKRILEDRRDFHDSKFEYLTSRGLHRQAAVHFRYAEKYRRHLGEAA